MVSDISPSFQDVSAVIGSLPSQEYSVKMVKQYKGLELSQEVRFVEVASDHAALQTNRFGYVNFLEGETAGSNTVHLHCSAFPSPVTAHVQDFDYVRGMINLSGFTFRNWIERQHERVQPKDPTYVNIRCRHNACRAYLEDISVIGIGILVNRYLKNEIRISPGLGVFIDFEIAPDVHFTRLKGTLRYMQPVGSSLMKVGIQLSPTQKQARLLERYVAQRREEILQEVTQSNSAFREMRGVESLYF